MSSSRPARPSRGVYLDDCSFGYELVALLQVRGVRTVTPKDAGLLGARDDLHLAYAASVSLPIVTTNPGDFRELHIDSQSTSADPRHAGIMVIYRDNNRRKDMTPAETADAIVTLFESGVPITGEWHVLNHWRR